MNTRKDNREKALKNWKAIGPGHIAKPLRFIRSNARNTGLPRRALRAANSGDGLQVQMLAKFVNHKILCGASLGKEKDSPNNAFLSASF